MVSCQSLPSTHAPQVAHVVVCWLKNPGDAEARRRLIQASHRFEQIPGVQRVMAGPVLKTSHPQADNTFDVSVVIVFDSPKSREAYEHHPLHEKEVRETLLPLVKKFVVYDMEL